MATGLIAARGWAWCRLAGIAAVLLAVGLASGTAVQAEDVAVEPNPKTVTTRTTTYSGWTVVCTEDAAKPEQVCSANFRVINKQNNQNILVWLFGRNAAGEALLEFNTLTEVLIKPGVVVVLDEGEPLRAEFISCGTAGCRATLPLDKEIIGQMKEAKKARIDMTRVDGKVIQLSFDIAGIAPALDDIGF